MEICLYRKASERIGMYRQITTYVGVPFLKFVHRYVDIDPTPTYLSHLFGYV